MTSITDGARQRYPCFFYRAISRSAMGQHELALQDFEKAVELDPDDVETHYHQALTFEKVGRLDDALSSFKKVIALEPDYLDTVEHVARLQLKLEQPR